MVFIVSEDFKGSCVLNTLKKALYKGMTISISGDDLFAPDVKTAINSGILVPLGKEYESVSSLSNEAMIVNRTDKVIVLGDIVLNPWMSQIITKKKSKSVTVLSAVNSGFVSIISDEVSLVDPSFKKEKEVVIKSSKKKKAANKAVKEEVKENVSSKSGDEISVNPTVWNFRDKKIEEAQKVIKNIDVITTEIENKKDDNDEIVPQKIVPLKNKESKNTIKKEVNSNKKKKIKTIEPVGDKKIPKTQADAAIELDSRGNPLEKASDTLNHLIESLSEPEEVPFVDQEQASERYIKRKDME